MQWFIIFPFLSILMRSFPIDTCFPFLVLKLTFWGRKQISFQLLIYPGFGSYLDQFELHLLALQSEIWGYIGYSEKLVYFCFCFSCGGFLWNSGAFFFSSGVSTAVLFLQMPTYDSTRVVKHCWSLGFQKRNLWHNLSFQYTNPHAEDPYLMLAN